MAKRLALYSAYKFGHDDKDPIIDLVHTALDESGLSYGKASEASGVSASCIYNWIEGDTRRPQYCTVAALMGALGYEQSWSKKNGTNGTVLRRRKVA